MVRNKFLAFCIHVFNIFFSIYVCTFLLLQNLLSRILADTKVRQALVSRSQVSHLPILSQLRDLVTTRLLNSENRKYYLIVPEFWRPSKQASQCRTHNPLHISLDNRDVCEPSIRTHSNSNHHLARLLMISSSEDCLRSRL